MNFQGMKKQPIKRKLLPDKAAFADIDEGDSPKYKNRKIQNFASVAIANTAKAVLKPIGKTNSAEWEDTLLLSNSKIKNNKECNTTGNTSIKQILALDKFALKPLRCIFNREDWKESQNEKDVKMNVSRKKNLAPEKKVLKATPFIFTAADLEDTPPLHKKKTTGNKLGATRNGFNKRNIGYGKMKSTESCSFKYVSQPKLANTTTKTRTPAKTVRKELFTGSKDSTGSPLQEIVQRESTMKFSKCSLIDVGETDTISKSSYALGKQLKMNVVPLNQTSNLVPLRMKRSLFKNTTETIKNQNNSSTATPFSTAATIVDNIATEDCHLKPSVSNWDALATDIETENNCNISNVSPGETEFIENEQRCKSTKYNNVGNVSKETSAVLYKNQQRRNLQAKFTNLQQKFQTFCDAFKEEMNIFQEELHNYNTGAVTDIHHVLDNSKENLITDEEWDISVKAPENVSSSEKKPRIKRNVTFNFKSDDEMVERCCINDNGLEKSVNLYNSLRKDYRSVLATPKLNRTCLQTPKALKNSRRESLSRKVQKQCLLLLDTPGKNVPKIII